MLSSLDHSNIVELVAWYETATELAFVMEIMDMSLAERLQRYGPLDETMVHRMGLQVGVLPLISS